jgi:Flp pilus assembly protein TadD
MSTVSLCTHGRPQDALAILKPANARHPADTDILTALATISRDIGDMADAVTYAEELVRVAPNNPQGHALYDSLRSP